MTRSIIVNLICYAAGTLLCLYVLLASVDVVWSPAIHEVVRQNYVEQRFRYLLHNPEGRWVFFAIDVFLFLFCGGLAAMVMQVTSALFAWPSQRTFVWSSLLGGMIPVFVSNMALVIFILDRHSI